MSCFVSPNVIGDGLVLYLDAANAKSYLGSGTAWNDISGNVNNGTLVNGPTFDNNNNGSVVFDGIDDYGTLLNNNNTLASSNITIDAWVKHSNSSQSISFIGGYGSTGFEGYWLGKISTTWKFSIGVGGTTGLQFTGDTYQSNTIQNLVGTYDGTTMSFYTNGVLKASSNAVTGSISYVGVTPYIGQVTGLSAGRYWTGNIYSYKIYNRALNSAEVNQNFNALRGRYGV